MHFYLIPPVFFIIALLFSMLGMGGGQLYIPILYWMGMNFKTQAIPLGLLLNLINSSSASLTYARKRLIAWRTAIPFGLTMVISAPIGRLANIKLPSKPVIFIFAAFTAIAGLLMLSGWKPKHRPSEKARLLIGFIGGSLLGFLTGLIGRGGGSFVVPLLYIVGLEPQMAAATSAMVVTFSGASGFLSHILTAARPQWGIWIACSAAVFAGSRIGSYLMAYKLKPKTIKFIFGWVLLIVAAILIVQEVILK